MLISARCYIKIAVNRERVGGELESDISSGLGKSQKVSSNVDFSGGDLRSTRRMNKVAYQTTMRRNIEPEESPRRSATRAKLFTAPSSVSRADSITTIFYAGIKRSFRKDL